MLKVKRLELNNIGPISHMELDFNPHLNIISGVNGVGKSTILHCLRRSTGRLAGPTPVGLRIEPSIDSETGYVSLTVDSNGNTIDRKFEYKLDPITRKVTERKLDSGEKASQEGVLFFSTDRAFRYNRVAKSDSSIKPSDIYKLYTLSPRPKVIKDWLIERGSQLDIPLDHVHRKNYDLARQAFSYLDEFVIYQEISSNGEILISTRSGLVSFERLPSGFQSSITILLSVIRALDTRAIPQSAEDFQGILLIDEIDLHLHPKWQGVFLESLSKIVPQAQIVATTHSPHVIQQLNSDELIPLYLDPKGSPKRARMAPNPFGFKGWTIEEILRDVMELEDTRSRLLIDTLESFQSAVDNSDADAAEIPFRNLMLMLHINNPLRPLYRMQFEAIGGNAK